MIDVDGFDEAERLQRLAQCRAAVAHRRREILDAQCRQRLVRRRQPRLAEAARQVQRQVYRARDLVGRAHRRAHELGGEFVRQPQVDERAGLLRLRHHLEGDLRQHAQRAPAAGEPAGEIVARHVLHDAPARLEQLRAPVHGADANEVIARGAGEDTARAREVGREHGADRLRRRWLAERGAEVDRLEREHLAVAGGLASTSASGVPVRADMTSSEGS